MGGSEIEAAGVACRVAVAADGVAVVAVDAIVVDVAGD